MNVTKRKLICIKCPDFAKYRCNAQVFKKCGDKFPWRKLAQCPKNKWPQEPTP